MTCPNCQAKNGPDDNFCLRCGTPLRPEATAVLPPGEPAQVPERAEYIYGTFGGSGGGKDYPDPPPFEGRGGDIVLSAPPAAPVPYAGPAIFPATPPRTGRTLGIIAIAGSALLLFLAALALVWVYTARGTGTTGATQRSGFTPTTQDERAVIAAIEANNDAQIQALKTLDIGTLDGKMTGQALTDNQQMVQALAQRGVYQEAQLISIQYSPIKFQDSNSATTNTVERWTSTLYEQGSGQLVDTQAPQTLHETYYLSRQDGNWTVRQVVILEQGGGNPQPDQ